MDRDGELETMVGHFFEGAMLALPAVVQPGPLQAFLAGRSLRDGWRATLPAAFAPLLSDGPIVTLVLFVLTQMPEVALRGLRLAGGAFLLWIAWGMLRSRASQLTQEELARASAARTLRDGVLMNLLNPNPYLFWGIVAGPILVAAWDEGAHHAGAFLVGFYGTFVSGLGLFVVAMGTLGRIDPRVQRSLALGSALLLVGFATVQILLALRGPA